jgi:geranylgeranyl diphosphate synthase type II
MTEIGSAAVVLQSYLQQRRRAVDATLDQLLPRAEGPAARVREAMRYAVEAGGKRLRPILALACCEACGADPAAVLPPAAAMELIHTYSLIHDDLPAMDDDDLRRGRPTVHRAFGEAEAILAGDALQCLAFAVLAAYPRGDEHAAARGEAVRVAAAGAGIDGMVGGQVADLEAERSDVDEPTLEWIHLHKTAALLAASAEVGAIHAAAPADARLAFARYGQNLGLAFQIADDILDCTSTVEALGKTPGKDRQAGKATYPALFGLDASRRLARDRIDEAMEALRPRGLLSPPLAALARYVIDRDR